LSTPVRLKPAHLGDIVLHPNSESSIMKIERYEITLETEPGRDVLRNVPTSGSIMHGILMEHLRDDDLHDSAGLRPYTQYLLRQGNKYVWTITILCPQRAASLRSWLCDVPSELEVRYSSGRLKTVKVARTESLPYDELMSRCLDDDQKNSLKVEFLTPVCFKKSGTGNLNPLPEPRLLFQSSLRKWNLFSDEASFDEREVVDQLEKGVAIKEFKLTNHQVSLDGMNMTGGMGYMTLKCSKSIDTIRLFNLVMQYGMFAGFGAKTAMGLGAAVVTPIDIGRPTDRTGGRIARELAHQR
jgi:CRISPR-associated endoribonuclease Cas6